MRRIVISACRRQEYSAAKLALVEKEATRNATKKERADWYACLGMPIIYAYWEESRNQTPQTILPMRVDYGGPSHDSVVYRNFNEVHADSIG